MIPVPHFFVMVGVWVGGETGIGEGQTAWQLWELACRMVLCVSNCAFFFLDCVCSEPYAVSHVLSDSVVGQIFFFSCGIIFIASGPRVPILVHFPLREQQDTKTSCEALTFENDSSPGSGMATQSLVGRMIPVPQCFVRLTASGLCGAAPIAQLQSRVLPTRNVLPWWGSGCVGRPVLVKGRRRASCYGGWRVDWSRVDCVCTGRTGCRFALETASRGWPE